MITYVDELKKVVNELQGCLNRALEKDVLYENRLRKAMNQNLLPIPRTKVTKKDLTVLMQSYLEARYIGKEAYAPVFSTKLYQKQGPDYCELLCYMEDMRKTGNFNRLFKLYDEYREHKQARVE